MDVAVATRTGFEPVISALTGQYVSRYTTGPGAAGAPFSDADNKFMAGEWLCQEGELAGCEVKPPGLPSLIVKCVDSFHSQGGQNDGPSWELWRATTVCAMPRAIAL